MKQCRDCSSLLSDKRLLLCPECRASAGEKRKALRRDRSRALYSLSRSVKAPGRPGAAHPCLTRGCQTVLEGKSLYCPECLRQRHLAQQRHYRRHVKVLNEDLPPEPITNLDWLNNFSAWAKSGLSYAEYQKAEWLAAANNSVEK